MKHVFLLAAAAPVLAGCALFEAIAEGLSRIGAQFADEPAAYVARVIDVDADVKRYIIDRVRVAENREDRSHDGRFEGLAENHVRFSGITFGGEFTDLALRPDGARLVGVIEEDIGGDLETYFVLTNAETDSILARRTLLGTLQNDLVRTCGVSDEFMTALRQEVAVLAEPPVPADAELEITLLGEGRFPGQLVFEGWSQSGDAIFQAMMQPYAQVRVNGELIENSFSGNLWLRNVFTEFGFVRFSAETGTLLDCNVEAPVPPVSPIFEMRSVPATRSFTIQPPGEVRLELFDFLGNLLRMSGQIDLIAAPFE